MKYNLTLICVLMIRMLSACDFCGCFMGITPYDNQSSITMMYRYKSFNGYGFTDQANNLFPQRYKTYTNISANLPAANTQSYSSKHGISAAEAVPVHSQKDYEVYTTAELRGKFFIHKRIELNAVIPFVMNSNQMNDEKQHIQGLGDITFFAAYHIISKTMTEKFQHRLILGAGIKLPTGRYNALAENGDRIDFMLQSGTGSVDYLVYANYIFGYKKLGMNLNSTYKFNGYNYYHEQISNSSTTYLNVFYKFRQEKNLKIFPSLQGYYEHSKGKYINNVYQPETKMNVATAGVGLDLFYKNFCLNASFQMPVYEERFADNLATAGKFMVGLTYSFNQKKYLIRSKQSS